MRIKRRTVAGFGYLLLACTAWLSSASASVEEQTGYFSFTEENDSFGNIFGTHQDRHYTQGLRISLFGGDDFATNLTAKLDHLFPAWGIRPERRDMGWIMLGQNIYTPSNLLTRALIKGDRPYAGWLYTGAAYQRRGELAPNLDVMENFEINLGIVGHESLAETAQETWHRWFIPDDFPRGWGNQLRDEPGVVLKYGRLWRWSPTTETARYIDVIPRVGGELGNVFTFATGGVTLRAGTDLPADFGVQILDSPASVNGGLTRHRPACFAYVFGSLDGRVVGHDITLDGNSFREGPSVKKNIFVADVSWGVVVEIFRYVEIAYTQVTRTEEFHGQDGNDIFGSVTIKGKFCF